MSADALDGLPLMLTVEKAAELLGVSRRLGYQLAREYLDTDGASGLPVVRLGARVLRVPRARLLPLLGLAEDSPATTEPASGTRLRAVGGGADP